MRSTFGGAAVQLTPHEYALLALLARNEGKLLTHQAILETSGARRTRDESHYLHVYVSQLRRKLEPDPARPRYILTEPGAGYRLVDPLRDFLRRARAKLEHGLSRARLPSRHGASLRSSVLPIARPSAPGASALPFALLCAAALALDAAPSLPWTAGVVAGGLFAAAGACACVHDRRELAGVRRDRRPADRPRAHEPRRVGARALACAGADDARRRGTRSRARSIARSRVLDPALLPSAVAAPAAGCARRAATFSPARRDGSPTSARSPRAGILLAQALLRDAGEPALLRRDGASARAGRPPRASERSSRDARWSPRRLVASGASSSGGRCRPASWRRRCFRRRSRCRSSRPTRSRRSPTRPSRRSSCCVAASATSAHLVFPISLAIAALLAIVVVSYMQTVRAYETSGGAYIVARENLGTLPSLVGGGRAADRLRAHRRRLDLGRDLRDHVVRAVARRTTRSRSRSRCLLADRPGESPRRARVGTRSSRSRRTRSSPRSACSCVAGLVELATGHAHRAVVAARAAGRHRRDHALRPAARVLVGLDCADRRRGDRERRQRVPPSARARTRRRRSRVLGMIAIALFLGVSYLAVQLHALPSSTDSVVSQIARAVFPAGIVGELHVLRRAGPDAASC